MTTLCSPPRLSVAPTSSSLVTTICLCANNSGASAFYRRDKYWKRSIRDNGGGKVPINPGYVLYHDNEKIVIRNYEGEIFEYPETGGDQTVQFAPQREYHDEYLFS